VLWCLESAFSKLASVGICTVNEIYVDRKAGRHQVVLSDMRKLRRHLLVVPLIIYESINPDLKGTLHDVTEEGLGTSGIQAVVGEVKSFVIPCHPFVDMDEIRLDAKCIWSRTGSNP
jgi:hypothetical protein